MSQNYRQCRTFSGYSGCFYFLVIVNKAAMNMSVQKWLFLNWVDTGDVF